MGRCASVTCEGRGRRHGHVLEGEHMHAGLRWGATCDGAWVQGLTFHLSPSYIANHTICMLASGKMRPYPRHAG